MTPAEAQHLHPVLVEVKNGQLLVGKSAEAVPVRSVFFLLPPLLNIQYPCGELSARGRRPRPSSRVFFQYLSEVWRVGAFFGRVCPSHSSMSIFRRHELSRLVNGGSLFL